jgi:hypothetical protein
MTYVLRKALILKKKYLRGVQSWGIKDVSALTIMGCPICTVG